MIKATRTRNRASVSCALCRKRKIRCNRETPCSNCIRSKTEACVYETQVPSEQRLGAHPIAPIQPRRDKKGPTNASSIHSEDTGGVVSSFATPQTNDSQHSALELETLRNRITELEDKLSQASGAASSVYSPAASTPVSTRSVQTISSFACTLDVLEDARTPSGVAISRSVAHKNRVFGQSHWMNGIVMFREIIESMEPCMRSEYSNVVVTVHRAKALARVIKTRRSPTWPTPPTRDLPPKPVCDELVAAYLRTMETVYRVLHVPSFQRMYESIWNNDTEPDMAFVVMLKLVLAIGATAYDENMSLRPEAMRWVYEAQTWLSSPMFKSQLGIQYLQSNVLLIIAREFVDVGCELVWISVGAVYRAAVYIGLHKDPSQLPGMSVLEAEMRRRVWNTILELSLQTSMVSGGPPLFSEDGFTTAPPGNFDDEQLLEAEPIARSDDIFTQTSVAIALRRTVSVRLAILKFLNDIASSGTYHETLRIDSELRAAYRTMRRTMQGYYADATSSPLQFALQATDFVMQRYITSLHVPFFASALKDPMFAYSRKATIDSSLKIWRLAQPVSTGSLPSTSETDLARMCRCTAGFFRSFAFHAAIFLVTEWRTQVQDEDDSADWMSSPLSGVARDAANWYLGCVQAGETGIKGYLLLCLVAAWTDATKQHVDKSDLAAYLAKASQRAADICMPLLEAAAGAQEQCGRPADSNGLGGSDSLISADSHAEDWDALMWETFHNEDMESVNWFML
ncbi:hypothetical protein ACJQWK_09066 [Exserohilum turcicum]